jgi:hypothetical protein
LSPKVTRRGFLGILGATGVAAAVPWKKQPKPKDVHVDTVLQDISSYDLEGSPDGEHWEELSPYLDDLKEETISIEGTWDPPSRFVHGQVCYLILDGKQYDMRYCTINMTHDVFEDTIVGEYFARPGLQGAEIECNLIGAPDSFDQIRDIFYNKKVASFDINLGHSRYSGKAFINETAQTAQIDSICELSFTLQVTGELTICLV